MAYPDLSTFMDRLEKDGTLRRVTATVDPTTELSCIARWVNDAYGADRFALRFDDVKGSPHAVAVGLFATRALYAAALGCTPDAIHDRWCRAHSKPIVPKSVSSGAVQANVETGKSVDLSRLPGVVWTPPRDGGAYLPAASVITRDPDTRIGNVAVYRVQIQDHHRVGLFFGTEHQHGAMHLARWRARGERMPVAIVIGGPPAVALAAPAKTAYGVDELTLAGGLQGEPVEVVRARTVDLDVPAGAEFVIEGMVGPDDITEGPFGEALGYMAPRGVASSVEVTSISWRDDAVLHGYVQQLPPSEGHLVWEEAVLGSLFYYLSDRMKLTMLRDLAIVPGSAGIAALAVVVEAGAHRAVGPLITALRSVSFGQRLTIIVDEDIDVRDPETLFWALSSRVEPSRDVSIDTGGQIYQLDPAAWSTLGLGPGAEIPKPPYTASAMIIDATLKKRFPAVALPTRRAMEAARAGWPDLGLPPLPERPRLDRLLRHHDHAEGWTQWPAEP